MNAGAATRKYLFALSKSNQVNFAQSILYVLLASYKAVEMFQLTNVTFLSAGKFFSQAAKALWFHTKIPRDIL
jgi:hypothetical protein